MKIDEAGTETVFRASEIDTAQKCMRKIGYSRYGKLAIEMLGSVTEKIRWGHQKGPGLKNPPSAAMIGGDAIDQTLTTHHGERIKGANGLRGSALTDFFITKHRDILSKVDEPLAGEPDPDIEGDGVKLLPLYERKIDPVVQPVAVQKEVEIEVLSDTPGQALKLVGHIDLERRADALPGGTVVMPQSHKIISDYKFTKKTAQQAHVQYSARMAAYDLLDGDGAGHVELQLLRRLKTPDVVSESWFVTKEERGHVITALRNVAWAVANMFFPMAPNDSWACSPGWCGFWQICKGRAGGPLPIPGEVNPPTGG